MPNTDPNKQWPHLQDISLSIEQVVLQVEQIYNTLVHDLPGNNFTEVKVLAETLLEAANQFEDAILIQVDHNIAERDSQ